jgi:nickel superoxide dismutase
VVYKITKILDTLLNVPTANAHCDIPCKIYDPSAAQVSAATIVRLIDIVSETLKSEDVMSLAGQNAIARCVMRKEEEAEKVKHEVRIIWGDYFKAPQLEKFPEIHELTHNIMMKASACKQGVAREDGEVLVELLNQFAEIFWATKDVKTARHNSPNLPNLSTVYPSL